MDDITNYVSLEYNGFRLHTTRTIDLFHQIVIYKRDEVILAFNVMSIILAIL